MLTQAEQRKAAKEFAKRWEGKGYEKGQSDKFWLELLHEVYGIKRPGDFIDFEERVKMDHTSYIDGSISATHVLIEQKSIEKDLTKAIKQSDGTYLSPFQQAKRYSAELPYSERPRWIVTCNFKEFFIYDMEKPSGEPEIVLLSELENDYYRMFFLVDEGDKNIQKEMEVSLKAGELVGVLYEALLKEYQDPEDEQTLRDLNVLCVRLVFSFYAEDAGLFGRHSLFHDYLMKYKDFNFRDALIKLFKVLDQKPEERDPYLEDDLAAFPYVNGELFADKEVVIPRVNDEIIDIILNQASANFDWSSISPTIFGGVFESTLNPHTRRSGGMHYTSIKNIHKVIDPLFMNELNEEFDEIKDIKVERTRNGRLEKFQDKLASLKFLDPAAGSGNFLTETYLSLRRLENEVIKLIYGDQIIMADEAFNPIKVSIGQFYGIEINDFAVTVARTALWIAESQMFKETQDIIHSNIEFLPLESYANIVEGNALRMDWEEVVPSDELDYIMGNPPFIGHQWRNDSQVKDMKIAFHDLKKHGKLDYVAAWYNKSIDYMESTKIISAFVSTNSICQGESVPVLWKFMTEKKRLEIQFAYQTFVWNSEAANKAAVHCVIIGFSGYKTKNEKLLYSDGMVKKVKHINGYLIAANSIYIKSRGSMLTDGMPEMSKGSQPTDGNGLVFKPDEYTEFVNKYPNDIDLLKRYWGSYEFINKKDRYCLWLKDISPIRYKGNGIILDRLRKVKESREKSATDSVREYANYPYLFTQIRQPNTNYLVFPAMSSSRRKYIPIGYLSKDIIASNQLYLVPEASLYLFGIMTSNVHMGWMKTFCGRLKSDYRYAPAIYNNFPFPKEEEKYIEKITKTASQILKAREIYSDLSLADLYNELTMPPELRVAHQANDRAVMEAYGFEWRNMTESECVAELMKMYEELTR